MSASSTISSLQQALQCAGKCDCCEKLQSEINNLSSKINSLESRFIPKEQKPEIVQEAYYKMESWASPKFQKVGSDIEELMGLFRALMTLLTMLQQFVEGLKQAVDAFIAWVKQEIPRLQNWFQQEIDKLYRELNNRKGKDYDSQIAELRQLINQVGGVAQNALSTANTASGKADTASGKADTANGKADTALQQIKQLKDYVDFVVERALAAMQRLEALIRSEIDTLTNFTRDALMRLQGRIEALERLTGNIASLASNAMSKATQAQGDAQRANSKSEQAIGEANNAIDKANEAIKKANQAIDKATGAVAKADRALVTAQQADAKVDALTGRVTKVEGDVAGISYTIPLLWNGIGFVNGVATNATNLANDAMREAKNKGIPFDGSGIENRLNKKIDNLATQTKNGQENLSKYFDKQLAEFQRLNKLSGDERFNEFVRLNNEALKIRDLKQSELSKQFDAKIKEASDLWKMSSDDRWNAFLRQNEEFSSGVGRTLDTVTISSEQARQNISTLQQQQRQQGDKQERLEKDQNNLKGDIDSLERDIDSLKREDGRIKQDQEQKYKDLVNQINNLIKNPQDTNLIKTVNDKLRELEQSINLDINDKLREIDRGQDRQDRDINSLKERLRKQEKVNEDGLRKLDQIIPMIGAIPLIPGRVYDRLNPVIPKIPDIEKAASTGVCRTTRPGGCMSNALNDNANTINDNTNAASNRLGNLINAGNAGANGQQLNLLNQIDRKLGNQIPGGISEHLTKFTKWQAIDRIVNLITMAAAVHNVVMLSDQAATTFFGILDNLFAIPQLIVDPDGKTIDTREAFGNAIENVMKSIFGVQEWEDIKKRWAAFNRIYQAVANSVNEIRSIGSSLNDAISTTATLTGRGFNALQNDGILSDYNWEPTPENLRLKGGIYARLGKLADGIQIATEGLEAIESVTSEIRSAVESANQIKENTAEIESEIKKLLGDEKEKRDKEIDEIKAPSFSFEDLF